MDNYLHESEKGWVVFGRRVEFVHLPPAAGNKAISSNQGWTEQRLSQNQNPLVPPSGTVYTN